MWRWHPLGVLHLASACAALLTAVISGRRHRTTPAAAALALAMSGVFVWSGVEAAAALTTDPTVDRVALLAIYPGVAAVVAGFYCVCRAMVDRDWRPAPGTVLALSVEPTLLLAAAVTNPWHRLLVARGEPSPGWPTYAWDPGPLFWLHTVYSYGLLAAGIVVVAREWAQTSSLFRRQLTSLLVAALIPISGNVLRLVRLGDGADHLGLTSVLFLLSGLVTAHALFRRDFMRLVPVTRRLVLDRITDSVIVLAPDGRLIDVNPAGERLLRALAPHLPSRLIGIRVGRALGLPDDPDLTGGEYQVRLDGNDHVLDVRVSDLGDRRGHLLARVVVVRDVTDARRQQRDLAEANARLVQHVDLIERLRRDLAEQAVRDVLTGLHNRRYLMDVLEQELARAARTGDPVSVVMLDIDDFKSVNDRHGHATGDRLLVATAQTLATAVREGDTLARYGGEEFVVVLPGATTDQARVRAEEWRRRCALVTVATPAGAERRTVSAGVATFPGSGEAADTLLAAADQALYAAKASGRDRVLS